LRLNGAHKRPAGPAACPKVHHHKELCVERALSLERARVRCDGSSGAEQPSAGPEGDELPVAVPRRLAHARYKQAKIDFVVFAASQ
jgi:hypothetical protein